MYVGDNPADGRKLMKYLWNSTYHDGLTGNIVINENGDREADFTFSDLDPETGIMRPIATYYGDRKVYEKIAGVQIHWPGGRDSAHPDVPYCCFTGEAIHCIVKGLFNT